MRRHVGGKGQLLPAAGASAPDADARLAELPKEQAERDAAHQVEAQRLLAKAEQTQRVLQANATKHREELEGALLVQAQHHRQAIEELQQQWESAHNKACTNACARVAKIRAEMDAREVTHARKLERIVDESRATADKIRSQARAENVKLIEAAEKQAIAHAKEIEQLQQKDVTARSGCLR